MKGGEAVCLAGQLSAPDGALREASGEVTLPIGIYEMASTLVEDVVLQLVIQAVVHRLELVATARPFALLPLHCLC